MLDPQKHQDAVFFFRNYFKLSDRQSGISLLREILSCYSSFPYENLSKIIRHSQEDDVQNKLRMPEEVMADFADYRLGGTCFALTFFLESILASFGFFCYPILADMRYGPGTHCALVVFLDGVGHLVDPGYLLNEPMPLRQDKPKLFFSESTGVELVYESETETYEVYTFDRQNIKWRYRFRDRHVPADEFLSVWKSSFTWNGMHGLVLTKSEKGRMVYVHKTFMRETTFEGKKNYNIKKDYHHRIHETFGIDPERVEQALAALELNMKRERESGLWVPKSKKMSGNS